jgi:pyruvate kinase
MNKMRKTKIVCTLGPVSEPKDVMRTLIKAGLNVARFNFSHGDYEEHGRRLKTVRELNEELGTFVATMLDTKGPEIRTNEFDGKVEILKGSEVRIAFKEVLGTATKFSVTYPGLYDDVKVGDRILVDDGYLELEITKKDTKAKELVTVAVNTHVVKSRRGVNVPNVVLNMPFISEKDAADIKFAATAGYDYLAASFVRRAADVNEVRAILDANGGKNIQIIAKIENQEGLDNLAEIVEVVDGIMVARGDLGVEIPGEDVPQAQSEMIEQCLDAGKFVIVATQMLESMQQNPRPTRAEVSDVANAVKEGTSATMLSGESAAGDYPLESVSYMSRINLKAEEVVDYSSFTYDYYEGGSAEDALAKLASLHVLEYQTNAIVAYGKQLAESLSKYRVAVPVIAVVENQTEARSLALNYGVYPVINKSDIINKLTEFGLTEGDVYLKLIDNKLSIKTV